MSSGWFLDLLLVTFIFKMVLKINLSGLIRERTLKIRVEFMLKNLIFFHVFLKVGSAFYF